MCFPKKKFKKKKKESIITLFLQKNHGKLKNLSCSIYSYLYPVEVYANGEITFIFFYLYWWFKSKGLDLFFLKEKGTSMWKFKTYVLTKNKVINSNFENI